MSDKHPILISFMEDLVAAIRAEGIRCSLHREEVSESGMHQMRIQVPMFFTRAMHFILVGEELHISKQSYILKGAPPSPGGGVAWVGQTHLGYKMNLCDPECNPSNLIGLVVDLIRAQQRILKIMKPN